MATIRVTITKAGRADSYGNALQVGTIYTLDYALGVALIQEQFATDTDGALLAVGNNPYDEIPAQQYGPLTIAQAAALASTVGVPAATGVAATDTANIQAAYNAVPATGGTVVYGAGTYVTTGAITITYPTRSVGCGSSDAYAATNLNTGVNGTQPAVYANESEIAATIITCTSGTANLFTVNACGCTFEDIHMSNRAGSEPTLGAAILVGATGFPANGFAMTRCSTNRFYISVDIVNSDAYSISFCKLIGPIKYNVRINNIENFDEGDPSIIGNWMMSGKNSVAPDAHIFWQSGGGLRIIGNKMSRKGATAAADLVRPKKGIWLQPANGVTTSVFTITGNSIEAIDEACILIDSSGTFGSVSNANISGNEFNCSPSLTNYVLQVKAGAQVPFGIYFGGNTINGCYTMVRSEYFQGYIGPNTIMGTIGGPLIDLQNGPAVGYDLCQQSIQTRPTNLVLLNDRTGTDYASSAVRGSTNKRVVREMPALNLTPTAVNLFKIDMTTGTGATTNVCEVEVSFNGFASGPGAFEANVKRQIYGTGAGTAAVATPVGWTDLNFAPNAAVTTGAYITWGFTVAAGVITITAAANTGVITPSLTSAFAGIMCGEVVITVNGTVRQLIVC